VNCLETNLLVIGGGATGTGIAWDAALRGFSVVLVEKRDLLHNPRVAITACCKAHSESTVKSKMDE
jgi:glycine/D-amino acid oxidase-like deaminating enzyme